MTIIDARGAAHRPAGSPAATGGQYAQQSAPAATATLEPPAAPETRTPSEVLDDLGFGGKIDRERAQQLVEQMLVDAAANGDAPWQKPWDAAHALRSVPRNATTDRPYSGQNALLLSVLQQAMGTEDGRWLTFKQMEDAGYTFRGDRKERRVKGVPLLMLKSFPKRDKSGEQVKDERGKPVYGRFASTFTVFHVSDMEGVPPMPEPPTPTFTPVEAVEDVVARSGAKISHSGGAQAFYLPLTDSISLPDVGAFTSEAGYTSTVLHELAHWTGAEHRLDRADAAEARRFGDMHYAKEELVAEIASYLAAVELGIDHQPDQHAAYVNSWAKKTGDGEAIRKAVGQAQAAARYLIDGKGTETDGPEA